MTAVGNPAPPIPAIPASVIIESRAAALVCSKSLMPNFSIHLSSPSLVISTQRAAIPDECATGRDSMALIMPDVGACIAAETVPAGSAIFCPLSTLSPTDTQAIAGAPIC